MALFVSFPILIFAQEQTVNTTPSGELTPQPAPAPTQLPVQPPPPDNKTILNNAFNKFKAVKGELKDVQSKLKDAVKEKRVQIQQTITEKRKEHLLKAIDVLIAHSENLKNRVINNKAVYGDFEQSIIAEINNDVAKLNELKNKINEAKTAEELNQLTQQIKNHRKDIYNLKIRKFLLLANIGRFEKAVIVNTENRAKRIADKIAELKISGKDVTQLESLLAQANSKIQEAKSALIELKNSVNSQELTDVKMEEIRKKLNNIKDIIKLVYDLFRQIASSGNSL